MLAVMGRKPGQAPANMNNLYFLFCSPGTFLVIGIPLTWPMSVSEVKASDLSQGFKIVNPFLPHSFT
jgi:hypothetical protein